MIVSCESCGNDFLTESDSHVVRPTPNGISYIAIEELETGMEEA